MHRRNGLVGAVPALAPLGLVGLLTLGACSADFGDLFNPVRVERHEQAGSVSLAVTMVAPWEDLIDAMKPEIKMNYATAKSEVLPTTSAQVRQDLRGTGVHVGIGFKDVPKTPQGATQDPPDAPGQPDKTKIPGGDRQAKELPKADTAGVKVEKLEDDPHLVMKTATALVQEGALLDRLPQYAALKRNHRVFVVRFQIGVIPYRRNLPYDVYSTVNFFTRGKVSDNDRPVEILPLLVTDNLEGTLSSRSRDDIRQITFALSAVLPAIAANFSLSDLRELIQSFFGSELNSLLTIGRITDNSIQVRLGAPRQPTSGYAMVPRTHNITALLLVPMDYKENNMMAVARSEFRDANEPVVLAPRPVANELPDAAAGLARLDLGCEDKNKPCPDFKEPLRTEDRALIRELVLAVLTNDLPKFANALKSKNVSTSFRRDMWSVVADAVSRNGFTADRFELPDAVAPAPPPSQSPTLVDNGSNMVTRLQGGNSLRKEWLSATLVLKHKTGGGEYRFVASAVDLRDGRDPEFTFPSIYKADAVTIDWSNSRLDVAMTPSTPWQAGKPEIRQNISPVYLKPKAEPAQSGVTAGGAAAQPGPAAKSGGK